MVMHYVANGKAFGVADESEEEGTHRQNARREEEICGFTRSGGLRRANVRSEVVDAPRPTLSRRG